MSEMYIGYITDAKHCMMFISIYTNDMFELNECII